MRRLLFLLLFIPGVVKSQEKILYLGNNTAIRINDGVEKVDNHFGTGDIKLQTYCTNPRTGRLQFYTDGATLWDQHHQKVFSRYVLPGCANPRYTAAVLGCGNTIITVKDTVEDSYYLFAAAASQLFCFSIFPTDSATYEVRDSICLSTGIKLSETNNLELVRTCDRNGFWLVVAGINNFHQQDIYTFYGTRDSVGRKATISPLRRVPSQYSLKLKISPDGHTLAVLYGDGSGAIDLFTFDSYCGYFNYTRTGFFSYTLSQHHAMVFSEDSRYLFVSRNHHTAQSRNSIVRFDLHEDDLDASAFLWQFPFGYDLINITRVGNALYMLWFNVANDGRWIDKLVDFRDTTYYTIIQKYTNPYYSNHLNLAEDPAPSSCYNDAFYSMPIAVGCFGDEIKVPGHYVHSYGDSAVLYLNGRIVPHKADSILLKPDTWGQQHLRLEVYQCGYPSLHDRYFYLAPRPAALSGRDTVICSPHPGIIFGGRAIFGHTWSYGNQTSQDTFLYVSKSGIYVLEQLLHQCRTVDTFRVTYIRTAVPEVEKEYAVCPELQTTTTLYLPAGMQEYYLNGSPVPDVVILSDTGRYLYKLVDVNGCVYGDSFRVENDCPYHAYFPNAFSPNGDHLNEVFEPLTYGIVTYSLQIYDRWGALVYHSAAQQPGWDGTIEGVPAPEGVYFYQSTFTYKENKRLEKKQVKGTFTLIR